MNLRRARVIEGDGNHVDVELDTGGAVLRGCRLAPSGNPPPEVGALCAIARDDRGQHWVVAWTPYHGPFGGDQ